MKANVQLVVVAAVLVLTSGCATLSENYKLANQKFDAVTGRVNSVRGLVSDVHNVKAKAKQITGR